MAHIVNVVNENIKLRACAVNNSDPLAIPGCCFEQNTTTSFGNQGLSYSNRWGLLILGSGKSIILVSADAIGIGSTVYEGALYNE